MAGPITWRNVGSTVRPGGGLSRSSQVGGVQPILGAIGDIIQNQQELSAVNAKVTRENRTQDYLDTVANASLEQLQDPEYAASLQSQIAGSNSGVNREQARGAIEQRVQNLQKQAVAAQAFSDVQQEVGERSLRDELYAAAEEGNTSKVQQTLKDHQFLDEDKLRNTLSGVADNIQQRQYRMAGEQRAEEAADRAAESHSLSMESGRETLAYNREVRADARAEREGYKTADAVVTAKLGEFEEAQKSTNQFLGDVGRSLGLNSDQFDDAGLPDQSKMQPDQIAAYNAAIKDSGIAANLTDTNVRQQIQDELKDLPAAARDFAMKRLEYEQSISGLAPADKAKAEATVQAANALVDQTVQSRTKDYNSAVERNAFIEPSKTPIDDVNTTLASLQKKEYGTEDDRREISNMLIDFASNGMDINGSVIPVPTSIIKNAIETAPTGFWDDEGKAAIEKRIRSIMSDPATLAMREQAPKLRQEFLDDINQLNRQKASNAVNVMRSFQARQGVTINPNDTLNNALKRR